MLMDCTLLYTHTCPVTEFAVASHLNTANSCCHHVFLRHFRFQKCLPMYSNYFPTLQRFAALWTVRKILIRLKSTGRTDLMTV